MAEQMTKWVAGFDYHNRVVVASCRCRETAKMVIIEKPDNGEERRAQQLVGYKTRIGKEQAGRLLHDHADDALAALHLRQGEAIKRAERKVEEAKAKLTLIEHYDTILEGKP